MAIVALCPTTDGVHPFAGDVLAQLGSTPVVVPAPAPGARWISHVAGYLASTTGPIIVAIHGEQAVHAAAIGFARRAIHRPAIRYVLTDPRMPELGGDYGDWPDAPVIIVLSAEAPDYAVDAANQARLRGWTVVHSFLVEALSST